MIPDDDELCGFADCLHRFDQHVDYVRRDDSHTWPCHAVGCRCLDYARPESVLELGVIGLELGDSELN